MVESTKTEEVKDQMEEAFPELHVDLKDGVPSDEIVSRCMECGKNGVTRFMYTKIPMFKEIILSSFSCEECGNKNTEVQFGGKLGDTGVKYTLKVVDEDGMNRSIVKSEFAVIRIPELDLEIPAQTQKGSIKTVEGFLLKTIEGLGEMQDQRRKYNPQAAAQIDTFLEKCVEFRMGKGYPFTFEIDDPSGNSFVQNPNAPNVDEFVTETKYMRTVDDYKMMGYNMDADTLAEQEAKLKDEGVIPASEQQKKLDQTKSKATTKAEQEALLEKISAYAEKGTDDERLTAAGMDFSRPVDDQVTGDVKKEIMEFPTPCYACGAPGVCKMCIATIPYFKEIIIMAYSCELCGYRSSEIKQGGGISDKATKITFEFKDEQDLRRDVFKSETCVVAIPELDFEMVPGSLGSMYTTVEGLLSKLIEALKKANPFGSGDSAQGQAWAEFIAKLETYKEGNIPFTLVLDDPLTNCFIYNPHAPKDDPQIKIDVYERTDEQNDDLGISQMNVD